MDEMTKQKYLDAISEIEDTEEEKLSDEVVWLDCFKAIITCPKEFKGDAFKLADKALSEFQKRFRKDEISH